MKKKWLQRVFKVVGSLLRKGLPCMVWLVLNPCIHSQLHWPSVLSGILSCARGHSFQIPSITSTCTQRTNCQTGSLFLWQSQLKSDWATSGTNSISNFIYQPILHWQRKTSLSLTLNSRNTGTNRMCLLECSSGTLFGLWVISCIVTSLACWCLPAFLTGAFF